MDKTKKYRFLVQNETPASFEIQCEGYSEEDALKDALEQALDQLKEGLYISRDMGSGWRYEMIVAGRNIKSDRRERND